MDTKELDGRFEITDSSKRPNPKKITGTRLASILGQNRWNTPFQMWCEITKAYSMPFEDTKYTLAGKAIEPKQLNYLKDVYNFNVVTPTDFYGDDYFMKTHGDFYPDEKIFGGMWDGIVLDNDNNVVRVIECKTTKRVEDWVDRDGKVNPPPYYSMQACLYAYLCGTDEITMIVSFLEDSDYDSPGDYTVDENNTCVMNFTLNEFWNFEKDCIDVAKSWWREHIETGISPQFDENVDKDYIKALRTTQAPADTEIDVLLNELTECNKQIKECELACAEQSARAKEIKQKIKQYAEENIGDKPYWEYKNDLVDCKLSAGLREKVDTQAIKDDGLFDKYVTLVPSARFTVSFSD